MPSLAALIKHRRASYLQKKIPGLKEDEPLKIALELVRVCNTKSYRIICNVLDEQISNILQTDYDSIKSQIQKCAATSSKIATYIKMNRTISHPVVYSCKGVKEYHRADYTRFRLSSHNLRIEKGRWSRTPREARLCGCGNHIQDEEHVLLHCRFTEEIRRRYNIISESLANFFDVTEPAIAASIIYEVLKISAR